MAKKTKAKKTKWILRYTESKQELTSVYAYSIVQARYLIKKKKASFKDRIDEYLEKGIIEIVPYSPPEQHISATSPSEYSTHKCPNCKQNYFRARDDGSGQLRCPNCGWAIDESYIPTFEQFINKLSKAGAKILR